MDDFTPTRCLAFTGMDQCIKQFEHSGEHEYRLREASPAEFAKQESQWVSTGIKIERELLARAQQAADERCLGRNLLIRMALKKFLDELIPIDQLTVTKKEGTNEEDDKGNPDSPFRRWLSGYDSGMPTGTSHAAEADPTDHSTGLRRGAGGSDSERSRVRVVVPPAADPSDGGVHTREGW